MIRLLPCPVPEGLAEPVRHGREMINDIRLWGSSRCRQMGVPLSDGGRTSKGDMILIRTTPLSQRAEPLAVVVWDFPETPHQTRDKTDFPRPLRKSEARLRLACPPLAWRNGAPHERGAGGESDPFWPLVRHGGGQRGTGVGTPFAPLAGRSLSPQ